MMAKNRKAVLVKNPSARAEFGELEFSIWFIGCPYSTSCGAGVK